jgi:uncharacterized delta-60 repeat protein
MQEYEVNGDATFTFTGAESGQVLSLLLDQQEAGNLTWPTSVRWTNGDTPKFGLDVKPDGEFVTGRGFNGFVYALALQPNGKILVGGNFSDYNGVGISYITRLNVDGSLDTGFVTGGGFNGIVYALALQPDGKILVGGNFSDYNGVGISCIARLNADGTLDTGFVTGSGFNSAVSSLALQSDGKILVGGYFNDYNGVVIGDAIARLNADGTLDTGFLTGSGFSGFKGVGIVYALALQSDGKILVGGSFNDYNGTPIGDAIARLNADGTLDTGFVTGSGFSGLKGVGDVNALALQSDGKILVGGNFFDYNGVGISYIARLNADGTLDTGFVTGSGFGSIVNALALQSDGKILVGGYFNDYNGVSIGRIARLNADGTLDTGFLTGSGFSGYLNVLALQPDGKILVGGNFSDYDGVGIGDDIARLFIFRGYKVVDFYYNGNVFIGSSPLNQS